MMLLLFAGIDNESGSGMSDSVLLSESSESEEAEGVRAGEPRSSIAGTESWLGNNVDSEVETPSSDAAVHELAEVDAVTQVETSKLGIVLARRRPPVGLGALPIGGLGLTLALRAVRPLSNDAISRNPNGRPRPAISSEPRVRECDLGLDLGLDFLRVRCGRRSSSRSSSSDELRLRPLRRERLDSRVPRPIRSRVAPGGAAGAK